MFHSSSKVFTRPVHNNEQVQLIPLFYNDCYANIDALCMQPLSKMLLSEYTAIKGLNARKLYA